MSPRYVLRAAFAVDGNVRTGNPAAVVLLDPDADDFFSQTSAASRDHQALARDINLSETAFASERAGARDDDSSLAMYRIRWFTPTQEIGLCGHASMATAAAALATKDENETGVEFIYRDGALTIERDTTDSTRYVMEMDASAPEAFEGAAEAVAIIRDAFESTSGFASGVDSEDVRDALARTTFKATRNSIGDTFLVIDGAEEDAGAVDVVSSAYLRLPKPDLGKIALVGGRGVCVVVPRCPLSVNVPEAAGARPEYCVRWFGPLVGINEDPVTGSACCGVAPLLARILPRQLREDEYFFGYQASRRGGHVWCKVKQGDESRVRVAGRCVEVPTLEDCHFGLS